MRNEAVLLNPTGVGPEKVQPAFCCIRFQFSCLSSWILVQNPNIPREVSNEASLHHFNLRADDFVSSFPESRCFKAHDEKMRVTDNRRAEGVTPYVRRGWKAKNTPSRSSPVLGP